MAMKAGAVAAVGAIQTLIGAGGRLGHLISDNERAKALQTVAKARLPAAFTRVQWRFGTQRRKVVFANRVRAEAVFDAMRTVHCLAYDFLREKRIDAEVQLIVDGAPRADIADFDWEHMLLNVDDDAAEKMALCDMETARRVYETGWLVEIKCQTPASTYRFCAENIADVDEAAHLARSFYSISPLIMALSSPTDAMTVNKQRISDDWSLVYRAEDVYPTPFDMAGFYKRVCVKTARLSRQIAFKLNPDHRRAIEEEGN